ncbi:MAG: phosphoribosylglycinamide formyltransferase [Elusimicrobium sp.]|jgi:formyltetrahydrofolate-dependent phosphoribosylglycinamide formyltransferase|nr:phosphoribosylglycinamide formyltransferase [Elusimicrobium sp.]
MKKIIVFASGGGSNFEALAKAAQSKVFDGKIVLLVASKLGIGAVDKAIRFNIPVYVEGSFPTATNVVLDENESLGEIANKESMDKEELVSQIQFYEPDLICLAGYLKKVPQEILDICPVINIHPALLPKFGGKGMYGHNVHAAVLKSGAKESGATVHFVDCEYDSGEIIMRQSVPVLPNDTPETLSARVLEVEHKIYPLCVKKVLEGKK